jgi:hypothetical protein
VLHDMDDAMYVDTLVTKSGKAAASMYNRRSPALPNFLPHLRTARARFQILRSANPKKNGHDGQEAEERTR